MLGILDYHAVPRKFQGRGSIPTPSRGMFGLGDDYSFLSGDLATGDLSEPGLTVYPTYASSSSPSYSAGGSSSIWSFLTSIAPSLISAGGAIGRNLTTPYSTYTSQTPYGVTTISTPAGAAGPGMGTGLNMSSLFGGAGLGGISPILLIGGLALILMMKK